MATDLGKALGRPAWALVEEQHGVVSRAQLSGLDMSAAAIRHRLRTGRLHELLPGVYAVGRMTVTREGLWMAAVLACGEGGLLCDSSAGELLAMLEHGDGRIHVAVPLANRRRPRGVVVHRRRASIFGDAGTCKGIPVTSPIRTLLDCSLAADDLEIERMLDRGDQRELLDLKALPSGLDGMKGERGIGRIRAVVNRLTFTLSDSELEGRFMALVGRARLPIPLTRQYVNGFRVDFHWPDLDLVVETDGLRYHRTQGQQRRDRVRDQAHAAAGTTSLRFTHFQIRYEPADVRAVLVAVIARLRRARPSAA